MHRDDCAQPALLIGDKMKRFVRIEIGIAPRGVHGSPNRLPGNGILGRSTGLEPATPGTTNRCSNQLSYDRHEAPWIGRGGSLRKPIRLGKRQRGIGKMANETMRKFGFPGSLVRDFEHWVVLLRRSQVTLGSLVLAAKSDAMAFGALPAGAHAELSRITAEIEATLKAEIGYDRINYLMLMMVDPNVHFHVFPRYAGTRDFDCIDIEDKGWPGPPDLKSAVEIPFSTIEKLRNLLIEEWSGCY